MIKPIVGAGPRACPDIDDEPTKGQPRGVVPMDGANMKHNPKIHHRRSIRLKGYDYSQAGLYFITICTQNRLCLFGDIKNEGFIFNDSGRMVQTIWNEIPIYYDGFNIHEFVVMPNHIHGIIEIKNKLVGAGPRACPDIDDESTKGQPQGVAPTMSLSDIVHRFKTLTTKRYTDGVKQKNWQRFDKKLWQRNYYEHIIRDENSYLKISKYIKTNPLKWQDDTYYE